MEPRCVPSLELSGWARRFSRRFCAAASLATSISPLPSGPRAEPASGAGSAPERSLVLCLSLSRLNHWLPRIQAHPEVVQGTTEFHHQIADALLPQTDPVFHNAAALDTPVDVLNP